MCVRTGRGFATGSSPVQGVLPIIPGQETEKLSPMLQKREQAPKCRSNEEGGEKKKKLSLSRNSSELT
jgi:hypothetical protein